MGENKTVQNVASLQSLRPAETTSSSQATILTGNPKEIKSLAEKFAKAVVRKNVYGKLPVGSKINSVEINRSDVGHFSYHGSDEIPLSPLERNVLERLHNNIHEHQNIYGYRDKVPDLMNFHIVSVTPSEIDHENMVLTIHFFQDRKQVDSRRGCSAAHVSTELPSGVMTEFLEEILKNPDLLEDFYKKTFAGLDSQDGSPGMRRIKANGFFLISGTKCLEVGKIREHDYEAAAAFLNSLERHLYRQGPYGTGDAFQPI